MSAQPDKNTTPAGIVRYEVTPDGVLVQITEYPDGPSHLKFFYDVPGLSNAQHIYTNLVFDRTRNIPAPTNNVMNVDAPEHMSEAASTPLGAPSLETPPTPTPLRRALPATVVGSPTFGAHQLASPAQATEASPAVCDSVYIRPRTPSPGRARELAWSMSSEGWNAIMAERDAFPINHLRTPEGRQRQTEGFADLSGRTTEAVSISLQSVRDFENSKTHDIAYTQLLQQRMQALGTPVPETVLQPLSVDDEHEPSSLVNSFRENYGPLQTDNNMQTQTITPHASPVRVANSFAASAVQPIVAHSTPSTSGPASASRSPTKTHLHGPVLAEGNAIMTRARARAAMQAQQERTPAGAGTGVANRKGKARA